MQIGSTPSHLIFFFLRKNQHSETGRARCNDAHLQLSQALQTLLRCSDIGLSPASGGNDGSSARFFICNRDAGSLSGMRWEQEGEMATGIALRLTIRFMSCSHDHKLQVWLCPCVASRHLHSCSHILLEQCCMFSYHCQRVLIADCVASHVLIPRHAFAIMSQTASCTSGKRYPGLPISTD